MDRTPGSPIAKVLVSEVGARLATGTRVHLRPRPRTTGSPERSKGRSDGDAPGVSTLEGGRAA